MGNRCAGLRCQRATAAPCVRVLAARRVRLGCAPHPHPPALWLQCGSACPRQTPNTFPVVSSWERRGGCNSPLPARMTRQPTHGFPHAQGLGEPVMLALRLGRVPFTEERISYDEVAQRRADGKCRGASACAWPPLVRAQDSSSVEFRDRGRLEALLAWALARQHAAQPHAGRQPTAMCPRPAAGAWADRVLADHLPPPGLLADGCRRRPMAPGRLHFGQVPQLTLRDGTRYAQSQAMLRWAGSVTGPLPPPRSWCTRCAWCAWRAMSAAAFMVHTVRVARVASNVRRGVRARHRLGLRFTHSPGPCPRPFLFHRCFRGASRAVQFHPDGGQLDFVWLTARTPHGAHVW